MARELFTDGVNSASHVGLGMAGGKNFFLPFLAYQYWIKPDHNSGVDTLEYLSGWLAGSMFAETSYPGAAGLGDTVSSGQQISWSGSLAPLVNQPGFFDWGAAVQKFVDDLTQQGFRVNKVETDYTSGNLSVNLTSPAFASTQDAKGLIDGVVQDAGFLFQGVFGNSRIQSTPQQLYTPPQTNILGAPGGLFTNAVDWWSQAATEAVGGGGLTPDLNAALGMIPTWVWVVGIAVLAFGMKK